MDSNRIKIMETTAGFYKQNEEEQWMYAPNFVYAPDYTLLKEEKDTYEYPVDGWTWYDEQPYVNEEAPI
jgi:hypothetical protein